jgi:plasmid stabilization system protein ParE
VLSRGAAADLEEIARYSREEWGEARCLAYLNQLEDAAAALATGARPFKDLGAVLPRLRMARSGRHCIFCVVRPGVVPVVLAILHERMDVLVRLKERLG